jgi:hypothetical protein
MNAHRYRWIILVATLVAFPALTQAGPIASPVQSQLGIRLDSNEPVRPGTVVTATVLDPQLLAKYGVRASKGSKVNVTYTGEKDGDRGFWIKPAAAETPVQFLLDSKNNVRLATRSFDIQLKEGPDSAR